MMYSSYKRQCILHHYHLEHRAPTICKLMQEEGLPASCVGIQQFLQKYRDEKHTETPRFGPTYENNNYGKGVCGAEDEGGQ